jgi:HlyD family secretion protein
LKKIAGISFIALLAACTFVGCNLREDPARSSIVGTIETDEVHVASRYGGRVDAIYAAEGQALTNGQLIVKLEANELKARRDQTVALLAELEAGPRKEEIAAARNDWEASAASLDLARLEEKRQVELFAQKVGTDAERDRAVAQVRTLEKTTAAAKSRYDLLLAGTRPERIAQVRAQLEELDTQWREMNICAPTNCVLEVLSVKVGDVLAANREAATLLLSDHLWVRVYVPELWLSSISLGQKVKVRPEANGGREFSGEVEQISRAAEFTPRNVQTREDRIKQVFGIKVRLKNDADQLRAGMSVEVVFPNTPR